MAFVESTGKSESVGQGGSWFFLLRWASSAVPSQGVKKARRISSASCETETMGAAKNVAVNLVLSVEELAQERSEAWLWAPSASSFLSTPVEEEEKDPTSFEIAGVKASVALVSPDDCGARSSRLAKGSKEATNPCGLALAAGGCGPVERGVLFVVVRIAVDRAAKGRAVPIGVHD